METFKRASPEQNGHHFAREIFKLSFLPWKLLHFVYNFTEICSQRSKRQKIRSGLYNDLTPNSRQAIIRTNDSKIWWCKYASYDLNESTYRSLNKMADILVDDIFITDLFLPFAKGAF